MSTTAIVRISDEDRTTSTALATWQQRHAAGIACMYRQPWLSGIPWEDKCMADPVVVWGDGSRFCADHALTEGPTEWFHEAVEVTVLPDCPPDIAAAARARESVLRARATGTDGFDWRAELVAAVESWAARDGTCPDAFATDMASESFTVDADPDESMRRVRLALASAIAERRRTAARTEHGSTRSFDRSDARP